MIEKNIAVAKEEVLKYSFLYTFILGLMAHGYCFLNLFVSHDSLNDFYISDKWERAGFGRIFYSIYISLTRGRIVLPWLIGILALCWISVAVYFFVKIFEIKRNSLVFLVSGICVTNPTVYALGATYIHDLDADMMAMMLSVAAVFMWYQLINADEKRRKFHWLIGGILALSVSLGIYQSFIALFITVVIFYSLKDLLEKKKIQQVLFNGCYALAMMGAAGIVYVVELKVFEILTGVSTMNSATYNGIGNITQAFSGNIFENILNTYIGFVNAFKNLILTSYPEVCSIVLLGIVVAGIIAIALWGLWKIEWKSKILFVFLSVILPFAMNITCFLSGGTAHVLTQYAVWILYLLAVVLVLWFEKESLSVRAKKVVAVLVFCSLLLLLGENVQTANSIYVKKDLEYQTTLSYMTRVADRMEEQEKYIPGETPVLIIGENLIGRSKTGFERYEILTGIGCQGSITYYDTYKDYFKYVLARPISFCYDNELKDSEEVFAMPVFPKQGSVQMIDGVLVVKLAEK